jgi:hypothetical protein
MTEYIAQEDYLRQKRALKEAQAKPEPERRAAVEATVLATLAEWRGKVWPDDWSLWQRALDDVRHWRDQVPLEDFAAQVRQTERERIDALYPEHARQALIVDKSQAIGEFIEWLTSEHGYVIAEWGTGEPGDDRSEHRLWPVNRGIQSWLAQYFQIDPAKIEAEKRAMLDAMRAQHEAASA